MHGQKKRSHEFGLILEIIIGAVQVAAQGTASAIQHDQVKKAQKKQGKLLGLLHQQRLKDIEGEGLNREEALRLKAEAGFLEEKTIRTATYLGTATAVIAALVLVYFIYGSQKDAK